MQPRLSKTAEKPKHKSGVPRYIESVPAAYTPHRDDDDFVLPRALIRKVMDNGQRDRFNLIGHLKDGVSEPVLARALEYWRSIDKEIGDRVAEGFRV